MNVNTPQPSKSKSTRQQLVEAAADIFGETGYWGTDSNRIAKAAGFAPGTFYRHFKDKREIFLAAYELRAANEWREICDEMTSPRKDTMQRVVRVILKHHKQRIGLRHSLRSLTATDSEVRDIRQQDQQIRLDRTLDLFEESTGTRPAPFDTYLAMLTVERYCDAVADNEVNTLGFGEEQVVEKLAKHLDELTN